MNIKDWPFECSDWTGECQHRTTVCQKCEDPECKHGPFGFRDHAYVPGEETHKAFLGPNKTGEAMSCAHTFGRFCSECRPVIDCDDALSLLTSGDVTLPIKPGQRVSKELALFLNNAITIVEALRSLQVMSGTDNPMLTLVDDYRRSEAKPEASTRPTDEEQFCQNPDTFFSRFNKPT